MRIIPLLVLVLIFVAASCVRVPAPPAQPPQRPLMLSDVRGVPRAPLEVTGSRAVVVIFIGAQCPISNSYAPELNRICEEYEPRGVRLYCVYADADLSAAEARQQANDFGYRCPVLLDPRHVLADKLGATVTPEAFMLAPGASIVYRGRIDDQWAALARRRHEVTSRDLRAALDAVLAGRPIATPVTTPIGCRI